MTGTLDIISSSSSGAIVNIIVRSVLRKRYRINKDYISIGTSLSDDIRCAFSETRSSAKYMIVHIMAKTTTATAMMIKMIGYNEACEVTVTCTVCLSNCCRDIHPSHTGMEQHLN